MTTEECGLNPFLEGHGIQVTDTDLGERIVQLFGEPPSHIVTPAIHRSRREVGELFARHGLVEAGEEDPTRLTMAARHSLRRLFLAADLGITGANFLVAETGSVVVIENEANSLLGTSLPRVHVVVAGIEKLVPRLDDLATFLTVLAPSSTGQRLTTYSTHYTGPQPVTAAERALGLGERELHVILLDNGRRALLGTPAEEALGCIRCGACLNACPVFRRVGGHAYGWVIPGPIGKVLAPGLGGGERAELVKASSLCGACNDVCPVAIDLSRHIHDWRGVLHARRQLGPAPLPPGLELLLRHPRLWRLLTGTLRRLGPVAGWALRLTPAVRAYEAGGQRRLPTVPRRTFHDWWRSRAPGGPAANPAAASKGVRPAPAAGSAVPADLERLFDDSLAHAGGERIGRDALPAGALATEAARRVLARLGVDAAPAPAGKGEIDGTPWLVATARWRVARMGTLWVDFRDLESRAQLLLAEGLILLVPAEPLLRDLGAHYARLPASELPPCGTMVTGPSKTADIEQTLVMGAHGPKRLLVVTADAAVFAAAGVGR
jgi:L-lactate dehydrogenase complex protein LldF